MEPGSLGAESQSWPPESLMDVPKREEPDSDSSPIVERLPLPSITDTRKAYMKRALAMAEQALAQGETPVGCVLVADDTIIASGMNATNATFNGTRHAEVVAISALLDERAGPASHDTSESPPPVFSPSILSSTDLYVTVEPCIMCASLLRQYHIRAVYYGCANDRFGGNGSVVSLHVDPGFAEPPYPSRGGVYRDEAVDLLRRFYLQQNERAPKPRPKKKRETVVEE
jgi:tRNA-specific adenosine deaminase 2